jgi:hypothetical protein
MKQRDTTTLSETISNSCGDTPNLYGILNAVGGIQKMSLQKGP